MLRVINEDLNIELGKGEDYKVNDLSKINLVGKDIDLGYLNFFNSEGKKVKLESDQIEIIRNFFLKELGKRIEKWKEDISEYDLKNFDVVLKIKGNAKFPKDVVREIERNSIIVEVYNEDGKLIDSIELEGKKYIKNLLFKKMYDVVLLKFDKDRNYGKDYKSVDLNR